MNKYFGTVFLFFLFVGAQSVAHAQKTFKDIEYAKPDGYSLKLDLYVPEKGDGPFPLVVWIHGGGWRQGSKTMCAPLNLGYCNNGYAAASLSYRFTNVAPYPAQLQDVKAAIRWFRANAEKYNLASDRIGVWGGSAGGHLSSLLGVTGRTEEFDVGENLDQSSEVQAVCNWYGPAEIETALDGLDPSKDLTKLLVEMYKDLLGGTMAEKVDLAKKASPMTYIHADTPPFLHVHGTADDVVPVKQTEDFHDRLRQSGIKSRMFLLPQSGHGGNEFLSPKLLAEIRIFFDGHLK